MTQFNRIIALDTETTGIRPQEGHKVIEIGCVEIIDKVITNKFHAYINPKRDVPKEAVKVHGLTHEFLQDKPIFSDIKDSFLKFIEGATLVIHNARFDMGFLNHELKSIGCKTLAHNVIDSLEIARKKFPGQANDLNSLCKRFNISIKHREKHGALIDAELLANVYIELIGGVQDTISFEETKTKEINVKLNYNQLYKEPRMFNLTKEEEELHSNFIKKLKDPIWLV